MKIQKKDVNSLDVLLFQSGDEIRGKINISGDLVFSLEAIVEILKAIATKAKLPPEEVAKDVFKIVAGKVV